MTVLNRRERWRAVANQRIRQILAVRRAAAPPPAPVPAGRASAR
ncbi:hypothetical protein [Rhizomonospora bruguierae]|nr:hypothetical protein [Micromonospora sp. NBRC 107566]